MINTTSLLHQLATIQTKSDLENYLNQLEQSAEIWKRFSETLLIEKTVELFSKLETDCERTEFIMKLSDSSHIEACTDYWRNHC